jgi:hypothetical protein
VRGVPRRFLFTITTLVSVSSERYVFQANNCPPRYTRHKTRELFKAFRNFLTSPQSSLIVIYFLLLEVWYNPRLSNCLLFCDSAQQALHLFPYAIPQSLSYQRRVLVSPRCYCHAMLLNVDREMLHTPHESRKTNTGTIRRFCLTISPEPLLPL